MAGKSDFMKREAELEMEITEKIAERKPPVQYNQVEKEKIAERKPPVQYNQVEKEKISERVAPNSIQPQGLVDNCSKLNVREFPNIDAKVLTILNKGDKVQITSDNDGWYGVVYKGLSGFCMKEYINKKEV